MLSGNLQIKLAAKITLPALPTPPPPLCHSCVLVAMASLACSGLPPTPPMLFQCFNDYGYRFHRRALTPPPPMSFLRFNGDGIFSLQRCLTPHAHHPFPVLQRRWLPLPSSRSHPPHPPMSFLRFSCDGLFFCLVIFDVLAWLLLGVVCLGWMGFFYFLAGGWLASLAA